MRSEVVMVGPPANRRIYDHARRLASGGAVALILVSGCSSNRPNPNTVTNPASTNAPPSASTPFADPSTTNTAPGPAEASSSTTTTPTTTPTTTTPTPTTTTTTLPPTTTTTIAIVTEGAKVLVANASAVPGAAGRLTERFGQLGFPVAEAVNAAGNERSLDVSKVYFLPQAEAAANSIGLLMGGISVSPMPTPAPVVGATIGLGDATVLVMLGRDLAKNPLPGLPGG